MTVQAKVNMSLKHFHDFYFLQALKAGLSCELAKDPSRAFSRSVEKLENDIDETMDDVIPNMALRTFVYLYAACLGETRHAREAVAKDRYIPATRGMHRGGLYQAISDYKPTPHNVNILIRTFEQEWRSGFGGKAWLGIAKALKMYFTAPPAAFIDHVIDLEHNGGTAFNKTDARGPLKFTASYPTRLSYFLDYKFKKDILTSPPAFMDALEVTPKVYKLVNRFSMIFHRKEVKWLTPTLDTLDEYVVSWGGEELTEEDKWAEWADVSIRNEPNANYLLEVCGIERIYAGKLTEKQLVAKYKYIKTKAFKKAGKYLTPELKKSIVSKVERAQAYNMKYAMIDKKKITYQALPVTIKHNGGYKFTITVHVPYEGYGTKVDDGFECNAVIPCSKKTEGDGHITLLPDSLCVYVNQRAFYFTDKNIQSFLD